MPQAIVQMSGMMKRSRHDGAIAMRRILTGIWIGIALCAGPARARQVHVLTLPEVVKKSAAIVRVEVQSAETHDDKCDLTHRAQYRVLEVLKGSAPTEPERRVWHVVPKSGPDCPVLSYSTYEGAAPLPFKKGQQLIVFLGAQIANPFDSDTRLAEVRKLLAPSP
jgi:hypothetical protein